MENFVTVDKNSKEYYNYLKGTFSKDFLAIPVQTHASQEAGARVTFEIKAKTKLNFFEHVFVIIRLMRLELLPLTFGPLLTTWALLPNPESTLLLRLMVSLIFIHSGVFLLSDYRDFISGVDQMRESNGTKLLLTGKVRPIEAFLFGLLLVSLGLYFVMPWILQKPILSLWALVTGALALFGHAASRLGLSVFLCFGPLLVTGVALSFNMPLNLLLEAPVPALSLLHGLGALFYLHVRQFNSVMDDHMAKVRTYATRVGFDRARYLLFFEVVIVTAIFIFFSVNLFISFAAAIQGAWMALAVRKAKTPISSFADSLPSKALIFNCGITGLIILHALST
jgi:hypothetical protein